MVRRKKPPSTGADRRHYGSGLVREEDVIGRLAVKGEFSPAEHAEVLRHMFKRDDMDRKRYGNTVADNIRHRSADRFNHLAQSDAETAGIRIEAEAEEEFDL